jgi:flagellar hook-length control protein FliK
MPSTPYLSEVTETVVSLSKLPGNVSQVAVDGSVLPGGQAFSPDKSAVFSKFLQRGLDKTSDQPAADSDLAAAAAQSGAGLGTLLAQWLTANPADTTALRLQINTGQGKDAIVPPGGSTPGITPASALAAIKETSVKPAATGLAVPSLVGQEALPTASDAKGAETINPAALDTSAAGPGAKLKLDFSMFDESFPEGWQALFANDQGGSPNAKAAVPNPAPAVAAIAQGIGSAPATTCNTGTQISSVGVKAQVAGTISREQIVLDLLAGKAISAGSQGQAPAQNSGTSNTGAFTSRQDKTEEPQNPRLDLHTATGTERFSLPVELRSPALTATVAAATPGQVFARLTELQRQLVVENFSQSSLPAFQGKCESLTVDLNPPELGRVQVHVEKAANGNGVNAVVTLQDRSVGEYFQNHAGMIRKTLEDAGITLGGLSVEIRQQFNQAAQEKSALGTAKAGEQESSGDAGRAARNRKKSSAWDAGGLSRVEIIV